MPCSGQKCPELAPPTLSAASSSPICTSQAIRPVRSGNAHNAGGEQRESHGRADGSSRTVREHIIAQVACVMRLRARAGARLCCTSALGRAHAGGVLRGGPLGESPRGVQYRIACVELGSGTMIALWKVGERWRELKLLSKIMSENVFYSTSKNTYNIQPGFRANSAENCPPVSL